MCMENLLTEIETFQQATGLSDHRVGIMLANNGRLIERLRNNKRVWPETEALVRRNIAAKLPSQCGRPDATDTGDAA